MNRLIRNSSIDKFIYMCFVACLTNFNLSAKETQRNNLNIDIRNKPLIEVLKEIEHQTGYSFSYDNTVDTRKNSDITTKDMDVETIMSMICETHGLRYEIINNHIILEKKDISNSNTNGIDENDKWVIQGRIYDDSEPPMSLPGATIQVKNSTEGAVSDANGYFKILVDRGAILEISYIGYTTYEYVVTREISDLSISLTEDLNVLQEVTVTGFTEERKLNTVSSISTLAISSNLENKPILSLSHALQGGITGLAVTQSSGLPGADAASIKIRGISTLNNSDPLVLVDGIPMDMNNLDPTTIESVTILKDAAAAAIYGSRAANGVIVIKTKRGKAGRVMVSYYGYHGTQKATYLPEFVSAPIYMDMVNKAYNNIGGDAIYSQETINQTAAGTDPYRYPDTNWRDLILQDGNIQSHAVSVSGGSSTARFAIAVNWQDQEGLISGTGFNRLNIRANTSVSLSDNLSVNMDFNSYRRGRKETMYRQNEYTGPILGYMYSSPPNVVGKYEEKPERPGLIFYGNRPEMRNVVAMVERGGNMEQLEDNISINIQPQWIIKDNLTLRGQYSYQISSTAKNERRKSYNFFDYASDALIYTWDAINATSKGRSSYYYIGSTLEYLLHVNKHRLFTIGGINQELTNEGDFDQIALRSLFGKANYTFDDRYLIEFTMRADGSSRFGPRNKYGYFPSGAIGWNVHEESFLKSVKSIDNLKLRATYGLLGNSNIGLYRYQSLINSGDGTEVVYGNPDIKWETVHMLNIGVDMTVFKNWSISFDYYDKLTKDMIIAPPISHIGGIGSSSINSGEVRNRGWELDMNYGNRFGDFAFNIHTGIASNKNKIEKLFGAPYDNGSVIHAIGYPVNSFYVYETNGLLQENDFQGQDVNNDWVPKEGVVIFNGQGPGDIHYVDQDNNGKIDLDDRVIKGNGEPKLNYFGNISFDYKKINLEILFQGVSNVEAYYGGTYQHGLSLEGEGATPLTAQLDYWTSENPNARYPRLAPTSQYGNNHHASTFWRFDASYCRVKYIQLGYTFNQIGLKRWGVSSIRPYINAQNPFTFAKDNLVDPEARGSMSSYPLLKTYSVGVNINF